ncbi:MAG: enoyl-CoA hydratase-related protein [Parvularculaceae bacterium]
MRALSARHQAEKISAQRCLEMGLVNRVVPQEKVLDESIAWADSLATRAHRDGADETHVPRGGAGRPQKRDGLRSADAAHGAQYGRLPRGRDGAHAKTKAGIQGR